MSISPTQESTENVSEEILPFGHPHTLPIGDRDTPNNEDQCEDSFMSTYCPLLSEKEILSARLDSYCMFIHLAGENTQFLGLSVWTRVYIQCHTH